MIVAHECLGCVVVNLLSLVVYVVDGVENPCCLYWHVGRCKAVTDVGTDER